VDATPANMLTGKATGFTFEHADVQALWYAVQKALHFYHRPGIWWKKLAMTGMQQDFSWTASASRYADCYDLLLSEGIPATVNDTAGTA
ncbi:MAG: starch synthase, partial [Pseudomonadota bacterium]